MDGEAVVLPYQSTQNAKPYKLRYSLPLLSPQGATGALLVLHHALLDKLARFLVRTAVSLSLKSTTGPAKWLCDWIQDFLSVCEQKADILLQQFRAYEHLLLPVDEGLVESCMQQKADVLDEWTDVINKFR